MKNNIAKNRVWFITGLETLLLGVFFLFAPDFLDTGHFKDIFNVLDDTIPSIFLIVVGTFTVVNSAFEVEPDWHRGNVFLLEFLWAFYTATFIFHDIEGGGRPMLTLTSLLLLMESIRIFLESWLGDPSEQQEEAVKHYEIR